MSRIVRQAPSYAADADCCSLACTVCSALLYRDKRTLCDPFDLDDVFSARFRAKRDLASSVVMDIDASGKEVRAFSVTKFEVSLCSATAWFCLDGESEEPERMIVYALI